MTGYQIASYNGPEKYIFVSYAHKDSSEVFTIVKQLINRGYRIWYDEGIVPGSEWSEDIALHLNDSSVVLAFVTPNFIDSVNCRREINFAVSRQIPVLSVVLEPTKMPLGMELQLSSQQSVVRYNYETEAMFVDKICNCPDLNCCNFRTDGAVLAEKTEPDARQAERAGMLSKQRTQNTVKHWGGIIASVADGAGALILSVVVVLLFANYHQENLINYTSLPSLPDWFAEILPGVWHKLPEITSPDFLNLENLPGIAWMIAAGWFLKSIGDTFTRYTVAEKMVRLEAALRYIAILGHIALCSIAEASAQQNAYQRDDWLLSFLPIENLIVIGVMILAGYALGCVVNWIVRRILSIYLKVEL